MRDYQLIIAVLHPRGNANMILSPAAQSRVYAAADGYGQMSLTVLKARGLLFDWSHIRDSSHAAIEEMARVVKAELAEVDRAMEVKLTKQGIDLSNFSPTPAIDLVEDVVRRVGLTREEKV